MRCHFSLALVGVAVFFAALAVADAQTVTPREGRDYTLVVPALPADAAQVVVTEFFSYACPHCFAFAPALQAWEAKLPPDTGVERVAVVLGRELWTLPAQLFYALRALGKERALDKAVFDAIHVEHARLSSAREAVEWAGKHGVDRAAFEAALASFSVKSFVTRADQLARSAQVKAVPTLIVDGQYRVEIDTSRDLAGQLAVVDALIAKARAARAASR